MADFAKTFDRSEKVQFADKLRGLAALAVVVSHYLELFWFGRPVVSALTGLPELQVGVPVYVKWLQIPYFDWGAFGVALFFIISGFVIPFSFATYGRSDFLLARFFRIYPTYWVGVTITLVVVAGANLIVGTHFPHTFTDVLLGYSLGLREVLWHKSVDGIVWTLEIELQFYLVCAVLASWLRECSLKILIVPVLLWLITAALGRYLPVWPIRCLNFVALSAPYLGVMFIGVIFHFYHRGKLREHATSFLVGLLLVGLWYTQQIGFIKTPYYVPSYFVATALFAIATRYARFISQIPTLSFWSRISYPLYVVHGVIGYATMTILIRQGTNIWTAIAVAFALASSAAFIVHKFVEVPSHYLGRQLANKLRKTTAKSIAGDRNSTDGERRAQATLTVEGLS